MSNWRKKIRNAQTPTALLTKRKIPTLLASVNSRVKRLEQNRRCERAQVEWLNLYQKMLDEYHKIELELNAMHLNHALHSEITDSCRKYERWAQSIRSLVRCCSDGDTMETIKHRLNQEKHALSMEQEHLERELKQYSKSLFSLQSDDDDETSVMRKENIKFIEFCLTHEISSKDKNGGWHQQQHRKFAMLCDQYKSDPFAQTYEKLRPHFPSKSREDIKRHYEWYKLQQMHIATNKCMKQRQRAHHRSLIEQQKQNELVLNGLKRLKMQSEAEKAEFQSKLTGLHEQCKEIDIIRNEQRLEQQKIKQEEMENKQLQKLQAQQEWNEHRAEQKQRLDEFYDTKIAELELNEKLQQQQKEMETIQSHEMRQLNQQRVQYREQEYNKKIEMKMEKSLLQQEECKMKEERLQKLRTSVHKQLNQRHIEDVSGVLSETANFKNKQRSNDEGSSVELYPQYGYLDEKLFDDPKFSLLHNLVNKNLHQNTYAKKCIQNLNSATKARKDCNHQKIF